MCVCVCGKERRKFVDKSEVVCLHVCMCGTRTGRGRMAVHSYIH